MGFPGFPPGLPLLPADAPQLLSADEREALARAAAAGRPAATRAAERREARWTVDAIDAAFARGAGARQGRKDPSMTDQTPPASRTDASDGLNPLEAAGLRLDAAIIRFELAGAFATLSPAGFGDAEEEYFAAQHAYRDRLREITGADPDVVLRRLAR
jgi:hypothetical protein